jgi:hypothetical protein
MASIPGRIAGELPKGPVYFVCAASLTTEVRLLGDLHRDHINFDRGAPGAAALVVSTLSSSHTRTDLYYDRRDALRIDVCHAQHAVLPGIGLAWLNTSDNVRSEGRVCGLPAHSVWHRRADWAAAPARTFGFVLPDRNRAQQKYCLRRRNIIRRHFKLFSQRTARELRSPFLALLRLRSSRPALRLKSTPPADQ